MSKHSEKAIRRKKIYNRVVTVIIVMMLAGQGLSIHRIGQLYSEHLREGMHSASEMFSSCVDLAAQNVTKISISDSMDRLDSLIDENRWHGPVLTKGKGVVSGPSGKETYYNLNMSVVVNVMHRLGYDYEYWVRDDGVKMLGDYVMVAANLNLRPKGTIVMTSVGPGIVCDTGGFAKRNPTQIDIATTW